MSYAEAAKTLRKLPVFGSSVEKPQFEWPTEKDLIAMPLDKPIKIVGFNWKRSDSDGKTFAGIQLVLSNGSSSPLFLARNTSANNLQWVSLASDQKVRKIKG